MERGRSSFHLGLTLVSSKFLFALLSDHDFAQSISQPHIVRLTSLLYRKHFSTIYHTPRITLAASRNQSTAHEAKIQNAFKATHGDRVVKGKACLDGLPAELLTAILKYAVRSSILGVLLTAPSPRRISKPSILSLGHLNRKIRREVLPLIWIDVEFHLAEEFSMGDLWTLGRNIAWMKKIRGVVIHFDQCELLLVFSELRGFVRAYPVNGVQRLTIIMSCSEKAPPQTMSPEAVAHYRTDRINRWKRSPTGITGLALCFVRSISSEDRRILRDVLFRQRAWTASILLTLSILGEKICSVCLAYHSVTMSWFLWGTKRDWEDAFVRSFMLELGTDMSL